MAAAAALSKVGHKVLLLEQYQTLGGLNVTPQRVMSNALRAATPLKGLYLAGQDVANPGIPGALWGGLLAAASVDPKVFRQFGG